MKRVIIILLFIITVPTFCQWTDKRDYKEMKPGGTGIAQFLVPQGENYFVVVDNNHLYQKYDYNGNLIYQKQIVVKDTSYHYLRVSDDGKSYSSYNETDTTSHYNPIRLCFYYQTNELINDSIIFNKLFLYGDYYAGPGDGSGGNFYSDFNSKINQALLSGNFQDDYQSNGTGFFNYYGLAGIYTVDKNSVKTFTTSGVVQMAYTYYYNKFLLLTHYSTNQFEYTGEQHISDDGSDQWFFNFIDISSNKSFELNKYINNYNPFLTYTKPVDFPDYFNFAKSDSSFIVIKNNVIKLYKFSSDTVLLADSINLPNKFNNVILSPNGKYLIISSSSHSIDIYHIASRNILRSYNLGDNISASNILPTQDNKGFLVSNANQIVKLFYPDIFADTLKTFFTSDFQRQVVNRDIHFYSLATGNPDSFYWDFGDGTNSTEENPLHSYNSVGKYSVKLIVRNGNKKDSLLINNYITVNPYFKAYIQSDIIKGDPPLKVQFYDNSLGIVQSWFWDFGDSSTSTKRNPIHIYQNSGIYPVRLIVSDGTFNDTVTEMDYITVNQTPITDTIFQTDKIFWQYDKVVAMTGFQTPDDNYMVEVKNDSQNVFIRLNSNFDTLWTKYLYSETYNSPMQQTTNGTIYAVGDTIKNKNNFTVNKIDYLGNIIQSVKISFNSYTHCFDFIASDSGLIVATNNDQTWLYVALILFYYDNNNLYLYNKPVSNIFDFNCYAYSLKFDFKYKNDWNLLFNMLDKMNGDVSFERLLINETNLTQTEYSYRGMYVGETALLNQITDFKNIDSNNFCFIENNHDLYLKNHSGLYNLAKEFPNQELNSIQPLSNSTFAVCGSKSGYCWFAIMDTSGTILEEHTLNNRLGTFNHVSLNKDGSLLFVGSLYKNSFKGIAATKNVSEKIQAAGDNTGLYIMKTKPIKYVSDVPIENTNNFDVRLYPNPASDNIRFEINNSDGNNTNLNIYDDFGRLVYQINNADNSINLDLSNYSSGIYFYRLQCGQNLKTGKFSVIK